MAVCACEPRVFTRKYSPYFRYFYAWCYEEFVLRQRVGWAYAHAVAEAVFSGAGPGKPPEEDLVRGTWYEWYRENPDPAKLNFPSPPEYFKQWCDSHPKEAAELREFMTFGAVSPTRRSFGIGAQEYLGEQHGVAVPAYSLQPQSYAPGGLIGQFCGAMCQVLAVGMVIWFAGQCVKTTFTFQGSQKRNLA